MNTNAFLVLGPEASGTRLLTKLLVGAGCAGDDGHEQRWDRSVPAAAQLASAAGLVWRRSLPHAGQWPDLLGMIANLRLCGWRVHALILSRDWRAMSAAQVTTGHVATGAAALAHIRQAYHQIMHDLALADMEVYEIVNYEALVLHPRPVIMGLLARQGLALTTDLPPIYDGNAKHYGGLPDLAGRERERLAVAFADKYGYTPSPDLVSDLHALVDELAREVVL